MSERWKPEDGESYWYVNIFNEVKHDIWGVFSVDRKLFNAGNCFKTEEEAKAVAEKFKTLLLSAHAPTTDCDQLPKLTAEVFDRSYFPKTAKYAVVTKDGGVTAYTHKPYINEEIPCWGFNCGCSFTVETAGSYDSSDWQNSLIERPAKETKLPEWCKFDAMGWHKRCGYFKVYAYDELARRVSIQQIDDKSRGWLSYETLCTEVKQARPRLYNAEEMQELVGKVLKHATGKYLVTAFEERWNQVKIESAWREPSELAELWTHLDGSPCGKLEHLNEKGDWVE